MKNMVIGSYDVNVIASKLESYRETSEYKVEKDTLIDQTMSCDPDESIAYLRGCMMKAFFSGNGTRNDELRVQFLAAYDLIKSIEQSR